MTEYELAGLNSTAESIVSDIRDLILTDNGGGGPIGLALGGSHARGTADEQSDVDVYVLVTASNSTDLRRKGLDILSKLPAPRLARGPVPVAHFGQTATWIYDDNTIMQFNFLDSSDFPMNPMRARTKVLCDPSGRYAELVSAAAELPDTSRTHMAAQAQYVLIRHIFAERALMRGDDIRASFYLTDIVRACCALARGATNQFREDLHMTHPEKRFEADLASEDARLLRDIAVNGGGETLTWRLNRCLDLANRLAEQMQLPVGRGAVDPQELE